MKRVIALLLALALSGASAMVLAQDDGYIAVVCVEDEISEYAYGYDHLSTLQMINALMEDPDNHGIFLYLNSPGGYLYESDELYEKLMELPPKYRQVLYLYYYEELSIREIAGVLKISETAVSTRLQRARLKIKEKLGGQQNG